MADKRLIVVLGMHRSGTSALARSLVALGVSLGDSLMPAAEDDNPKGFFEDTEIYALNVAMLQALQIEWFSLVPVERIDVEFLQSKGFFLQAVDLISRKCAAPGIFAFKDPRIAKLLPFWRAVFSHCKLAVSYVVAQRHPRSVARSLAKRNGLDVGHGYLLWLDHMLKIVQFASDSAAVHVDYDRLVEAPEVQIARMARALDLNVIPDEAARFQSEFMDQALRHTAYDPDDLAQDPLCPPLIVEVYSGLRAMALDDSWSSQPAKALPVSLWATEYARMKAVLLVVDRLSTQQLADQRNAREMKADIARLTAETVARGQWGLDLDKVVAEREAQIAALQNKVMQLERSVEEGRLVGEHAAAELHDLGVVRDELQARNAALIAQQETARIHASQERTALADRLEMARRSLQAAEKDRLVRVEALAVREREWADRMAAHQANLDGERMRWMSELEAAQRRHDELEQLGNQAALEHARQLQELNGRMAAALVEIQRGQRSWMDRMQAQERAAHEERSAMRSHYDKLASTSPLDSEMKALIAQSQLQLSAMGARVAELQATLEEWIRIGQDQVHGRAHEAGRVGELLALTRELREEHAVTHRSAVPAMMASIQEVRSDLDRIGRESGQLHQKLLAGLVAAHAEISQWKRAHAQQRDQLRAIHASLSWRLMQNVRRWSGQPDLALTQALPEISDSLSTLSLAELFMFEVIPSPRPLPSAVVRTVHDLLNLHDESFVVAAYRAALGREADADGLSYYLSRLRQGVDRIEVLRQLRSSPEGRALKRAPLAGLDDAVEAYLAARPRGLAAWLGRRQQAQARMINAMENNLRRLAQETASQLAAMSQTVAGIKDAVAVQQQVTATALAVQRSAGPETDSWRVAETLVLASDADFLGALFAFALGRAPLPHEASHYLHLLQMKASRLHIVNIIFGGEECRRWQNRHLAPEPGGAGDVLLAPALPVVADSQAPSSTPLPGSAGIAELIHFAPCDTPVVSVVIPVFGQLNYTLMCLQSIQKHLPQVPFEVIVVDDCSPDNSRIELAKVRGLRLVANAKNLGFVRACNAGAAEARGQYLCFLNNDTEVLPDWLDAMMRTFHELPGTGLVGSKLLYPNNTLQEAGAIIWADGSAWNYGRNQDPLLPVFNYAREVDYCSGASITIPASLFHEFGGFDELYVPAYGEDSDLALKVRARGLRVIYQPLSQVIHYEGVTSGTDTSQGIKAYQVANARKLLERWQGHLRNHQANAVDVDRAKDRMARSRVLVLDHCTPTPDQDAGSLTVCNLLVLLRELGFQVTFIPEDNYLYMPVYTTALQRIGIEVLYAPYCVSVADHLAQMGARYDLVFIFRPVTMERHLEAVRKHCANARLLYHTVDLHFLRMEREAEVLNDAAKHAAAATMKARELAVVRAADASIVHSPVELDKLSAELPDASVHVFPLIMHVPGTQVPFGSRTGVVFVGGFQHTPNVDAVCYFVEEVMPVLRTLVEGIQFHVVGSKPPAEVLDLAGPDVIIAGFVEDLNPYLDQRRVAVAPLRYGAGIKGKIGSAMAVGLPTVATSLAAEGMNLTDGDNIVIADGAEALAGAIARLYEDAEHWNHISAQGLRFAEQTWGAASSRRTLSAIVGSLGLEVVASPHPLRLHAMDYDPATGPVPFDRGAETVARQLWPVARARGREDYEKAMALPIFTQTRVLEAELTSQAPQGETVFRGFCVPCDKEVELVVDMLSGGYRTGDRWFPNWRERLECPHCRMNSRQRLITALVRQEVARAPQQRLHVYFMEQVTPIFRWMKAHLGDHDVVGSEYLGHQYPSGTVVDGVLHQDVMKLSFDDAALDLIVSNDVFEHVPDPYRAFAECARVLRSGAKMLATFPFHALADQSVVRATIEAGEVSHHLPPVFHGNPVAEEGSLVFTDFGWDCLTKMKRAGFSDVTISLYVSPKFGHLGNGQIVFEATK